MIKVDNLVKGKKKNRYIVTLNGKEYDVDENLIVTYHLVKGHIIDDDNVLDNIIDDMVYYDYYNIALNYIEKYIKSSGQVLEYLINKGANKTIASRVVFSLLNKRLIDDRKYLDMFIVHYINLGYGPLYIINKAKTNKVSEDAINTIDFDKYYDTIKEQCIRIAKKKILSIKDDNLYIKKMKLLRFLYSRGYENDMSNIIVKELI